MVQVTAKTIEKLKPDSAKRREIPDSDVSGLYLVIQPSGAKSWALRYRRKSDGKTRKLTIGGYLKEGDGKKTFTLKQARRAAENSLEAIEAGGDPAAEKRAAKALKKTGEDPDLFRNVVASFLKRYVHKTAKPSYAREVERLLEKEILPKWGERRIQDISKRDVLDLLDGIVDRGGGLTANRVFAAIRRLSNWAVERDILSASPCTTVKAPVAERSRDRVLSEDEIRWLWRACEKDGFPFGAMVRFLLLTGARRSEVAGMPEHELDKQVWTIPGERTKNGEAHEVPLSDQAAELIEAIPRIRNPHRFLFCTNGKTPISGFSRAKRRIDALMLAEAQKEVCECFGVEPEKVKLQQWQLHDLRRTMASGMGRLGIGLPVIEKILNHSSGSFAGIVKVYQRHEYADEKRKALQAWARHIETITSERETNVVPITA